MILPLLTVPQVYHIGTLDPADLGRNSGAGSQEGRCLSVSVCPEGWRQIARLGGYPLWHLSKEGGGLFLDVHAVLDDQDLQAAIVAWAKADGLLEDAERWQAWRWDDELEDRITVLVESQDEAFDEADIEDVEESTEDCGVAPVVVPVATPKLAALVAADPARFSAEGGAAVEFAVMAWASTVLPVQAGVVLDGVWWRERYDPDCYSAPRGAVFPERVQAWQAEEMPWNLVEDDEVLLEAFEDAVRRRPEAQAVARPELASTAGQAVLSRYMEGGCHVFAVALHRKFGWPIHVVRDLDELYWTDPDDPDNTIPVVVHCYALDPDGNAWDIGGVRPCHAIAAELGNAWTIGTYDSDTVADEASLATYVGCWAEVMDPDEPEPDPIDRPLREYDDGDVEEAWAAAEAHLAHLPGWPLALENTKADQPAAMTP